MPRGGGSSRGSQVSCRSKVATTAGGSRRDPLQDDVDDNSQDSSDSAEGEEDEADAPDLPNEALKNYWLEKLPLRSCLPMRRRSRIASTTS